MNRRMKHHRARDRHDCSDVSFGDAVVVMSTNTSEPHDLRKRQEVPCEFCGREDVGVVCEILLRHNTILTTGKFEFLLRFEGLVCVEINLKLDVDESGGVVHKDTTSCVHVVSFSLAGGGKKPSSRAANEVVNGDSMPGDNVVSLEDVCSVADDGRRRRTRDRTSMLLAVLASCAPWKVRQLASCGVKSATCFRLTEDSSS